MVSWVCWVLSSWGALSRDTHRYRTREGRKVCNKQHVVQDCGTAFHHKCISEHVGRSLLQSSILGKQSSKHTAGWNHWKMSEACSQLLTSLGCVDHLPAEEGGERRLPRMRQNASSVCSTYMLNVVYSKKCLTRGPSDVIRSCAQEGSPAITGRSVNFSLKHHATPRKCLWPGLHSPQGESRGIRWNTAMIPSFSCLSMAMVSLEDASTNKNHVPLESNRSCRQATTWVEATHPWCTSEYTTSCWSTDLPVKERGWDMMRPVLKVSAKIKAVRRCGCDCCFQRSQLARKPTSSCLLHH